MRLIGTLPTESDARRFCDYLLTQKVDAHAEEQASDGAWQMWIEHDDDLDRGKAELEAFRLAPGDAKYNGASSAAKKLRDAEQKQAQRRRAHYRDVRTSWAQSAIGQYATPAAITLVVLTLLVGVATQFGGNIESPVLRALLYDNPFATPEGGHHSMFNSIRRGEVWRVVTPMFIHFGIFHLVFNMMWLWRLGQVIESRIGSGRFVAMVLIISALSCTAQALWKDYSFFGGMSGVVAGLFGYAWMKHKLQPYQGIHVTDREVGMMLGWLVICSLPILQMNIANAAHWGGLAVGMVLGVTPYLVRRLRTRA